MHAVIIEKKEVKAGSAPCSPASLHRGRAPPRTPVKDFVEMVLLGASLLVVLLSAKAGPPPPAPPAAVASSSAMRPQQAPTLRLPTMLASDMVIQRANKPGLQSAIWGWSNFSESISVSIDGRLVGSARPNVSDAGRWTVLLPVAAHKEPSSGHTIVISAGAGITQTLSNVAFGDVYVCSGQ